MVRRTGFASRHTTNVLTAAVWAQDNVPDSRPRLIAVTRAALELSIWVGRARAQ